MAYLADIFRQSPEIALFLSLALGYWVGKFQFGKFQLGGVAGSLLAAVLISQVGVHIDNGVKAVLFALFIYAVGFESGPQPSWGETFNAGSQWQIATTLPYGGTKCLDASGQGAGNGTAVIIWDCNGQPNQQWAVNANGTITGVQSGLCLDAVGAGTASGTKMHLWACHGGANQQWTLR